MRDCVLLVTEDNVVLGLMPKMEAHKKGLLHRAFSVFIFNKKGELMLQKRAPTKYHSPSLWTNTCCSHQQEGETNIQAGKRRLYEEMGIEVELNEMASFVYKEMLDNGLIEHEYDTILWGVYEKDPDINPDEVLDWKWIRMDDLRQDIAENSDNYTVWIKIIMGSFYENLISLNTNARKSKP